MNNNITSEIIMSKPIVDVFAFVIEPKNKPMVMPDLINVSNISDEPLKLGSTFDFVFQMVGVSLDGTWKVTSLDKPTFYEGTTTGGIESIWKYKLEDMGEETKLSLTISYTPPKSVLGVMKGIILNQINKRVADTYLHNLKIILDT